MSFLAAPSSVNSTDSTPSRAARAHHLSDAPARETSDTPAELSQLAALGSPAAAAGSLSQVTAFVQRARQTGGTSGALAMRAAQRAHGNRFVQRALASRGASAAPAAAVRRMIQRQCTCGG